MSTPSTTAQPQKDYHQQQHQLSNYHGHLNRLKNNVEKCGLSGNTNSNNNNNGIAAADEISLSNDNSNNSSSCSNKFRSPLIADSCSVAQFNSCGSKSPPETSNVAMLVNSSSGSNNNINNSGSGGTNTGGNTNGHFHTHHHHQQHIHQHNTSYKGHNQHSINSNSNISHNNHSNNNIISNSGGGSNMRKSSYSGSDPNNASFSSASVAGSLQDDNMSDQCSLTQAGLEEYNSRSYYDQPVFHHQKQSSYAQSEGYHSYVSSSDSSSATPFLDRLRQESELLSRQSHHWSQNDLSSSSNNVSNPGENNSSESTSSTETLKWLGSMSDVSVASHATSSSAVSGSATSSSQLIVHSSRVRTPKRHNSESVLYMNDDQMSVTSEVNAVSGSTTGGSGQLQPQQHYPQHPPYHLKGTPDLQNSSSVNSSVAQSPSSPSSTPASSGLVTTTSSPTSSNASYRSNHRLFAVSTYVEPVNGNSDYQSQQHHHQYQQQQQQQKQSSLAQPQQPQHQHQTAAATVQQLPGMKLSSPQTNSWQSVADRINDFERQQQHLSIHHYHSVQQQSNTAQKYSYIDPSKMHRVPNPALKAFQKNAVQSYFERQQQNAKDNKTYSSINNLSRPQSLQPANSPKEVPTPHIRTSLPNNYAVPNASPRSPNAPIPTQRSPSAQQIINSSINEYSISSVDTVIYGEINVPPPPPPRSRSLMPIRRSSSASDYADFRESFIRSKEKQAAVNEAIIGTVTSPEKSSFNDCGVPPPPPPPRGRANMPVRRTSSASEYAAIRDKNLQMRNLSKDLLGPIIMGPIISVDDWVPERPPKNPHLRIPSPDLPPPPLQIIDTDVNLLNQDEPLPPPPPEILRHIRPSPEVENKPPSPSRRNSFAGSPSRKAFYRTSFENLSSPPSVPKKPPPLEMMQSRPASSLAQSNKAHKVILNGKLESPISSSNSNNGHLMHSLPSQDPFIMPRGNDARISMRKRAHNANPSPQAMDITKSPGKLSAHTMKSPPPLKPRMPIAGQEMRATSVAINSKIRCNSKASYLPRQSRDKLNTADPDHGSYKLTLTSNEDSINHNTSTNYHHDDILSSKCNNLPDVLPVGAKVQPSSPSSSNSSPRYGSNNNITSPPPPHTAPALLSTSYPIKSLFHFQSPNSPNRQNSSPPANSPSSYQSPNRTSPFVSPNDPVSPKFMSQSTIDLKKTHILETSEAMKGKTLSPAQSESNIIHEKPQLSPFSTRREYQRTDVVRKLSLEERESGEGRIVRAELVNTILSTSPTSPRSEEKLITRKDSLRENIEKITQLQSKLMSAHLIDNGSERKLLGYTAKTVEIKTQQKSLVEKELPKQIIEEKPPQHPESPIKLTAEPPPSPAPSEAEKISQMDSEVDGLKLMQRTEIILRLNAPTSEAASQTDETLETELSRVKLTESRDDLLTKSPERVTTSILVSRKKLPEEIDCDNLSKDLASRLPPTDKLCQVLAPKIFKSSSDYVSGLYNPNVAPRPAKRDVATSTPDEKSIGCELAKTPNSPIANTNATTAAVESSQSPNTGDSSSAAATTTTRYNGRDVPLMNGSDTCDLIKKKEELVNRLTKKIITLGNEQSTIAEETSANDQLGSSLATKISEKVRPIDATKFRAYIDDVGHITMLLLSLSGRLAKVENALNTLNENHAEQKILETKRDRLMEQLEEAKRLKEDIDRRGAIVGKILEKNLTIDEYADYDYFINMKAKLIIDSREIADRMKLSEEQLSALKDTLVQSEC